MHEPADQPTRLSAALAARYALDRELGRGGMATVYLADDVKHRRKVALKVLRPQLAAMLGPDRFAREIRIAASLNHPNILPLHDSGEAGGQLFYVMPYVGGGSLRQRLTEERRLDVDEAVQLVRQVASALDHAHARGLIHRDIKPENILLHEGVAMVTDFGIAIAAGAAPGDRLTQSGLMVGTPAYMSPEQAAGEPNLDARSDVYSLGCVLYELLTGEPPHSGPSAQAMLARRFTEPAPSARRQRPNVPPVTDDALRRALAREPDDRFASAGAFAAALVAPASTTVIAVPERARLASVAVLPFRNLSADPENEFFADGITEDVIAQLSKIRSLKVISQTSVMPFKNREQDFKEIGARLEVATLLDGSVRRSGDRVRIVAQLIDAEADRHLWAETYDRQLTDIFAIQSDVALQIAAALRAELSPEERTRIHREPTRNLNAYQLYLKGRHWYSRYTEEGFKRGIEYFEQAIAADPSYAMAHVGMALAYGEFAAGQGGSPMKEDAAYRHGMAAVTRALALDSSLGEAHAVLGLLKCVHDFDWTGSEREFKLALELSPGAADAYDHYGWLCSALERHDEAVELVKRAQELDPLTHRSDVATMLLRAGRKEEALEHALRAVEFEPDYARGRATLGWTYLLTGRPAEGLGELQVATKLVPGNALYLAQLGQAYGLTGQRDRAREIMARLGQMAGERYVSPYHMAYVSVGLGDYERAIDLLERAYEERAGSLYGVKGSFLFADLRSHPRFQALLRKMNLA